jgi:hypothetical protein
MQTPILSFIDFTSPFPILLKMNRHVEPLALTTNS